MHPKRTRFAQDIVTEFLPPAKPTNRVIIFAQGVPGMPSKERFMKYYAQKGWWVFVPRYRGTWESDGKFLVGEPTKDIADVIEGVQQPFMEYWGKNTYQISNPSIVLIGSSFGGPAALLNSKNSKVKKVITIASVINWREQSTDEPLAWLENIIKQSFGQAYRFHHEDWKKLGTSFYNPIDNIDQIDGKKVIMYHAMDDTVVSPNNVAHFATSSGIKLVMKKKGGHLSSRVLETWWQEKKLHKMI